MFNNVDARKFFNKLIAQNHGSDHEFPQDVLIRFHGKDTVEIWYVKSAQPTYTPVHRVDQAQFKPRETNTEE